MKKSTVKICGLTNLADARFAAGAGADYLGFIFVEGTPRYIEPAMVGAISEWVEGPNKVGVFQNQELSFVTETVRLVGLDMIQLHGQESTEYCSLLSENHRIIKVFSVDEQTNSADLSRELQGYKNVCEYIMFDTKVGSQSGGTGVSFDWKIINELDIPLPYFLSGGLSHETVHEALEVLSGNPPMAIDVSSKIEESIGIKDFDKLSLFMEAVQSTT